MYCSCCCSWHMWMCVYSYSLTHTELFLRSLLDEEPVKTVVAPPAPRTDHYRANSKERETVSTNTCDSVFLEHLLINRFVVQKKKNLLRYRPCGFISVCLSLLYPPEAETCSVYKARVSGYGRPRIRGFQGWGQPPEEEAAWELRQGGWSFQARP